MPTLVSSSMAPEAIGDMVAEQFADNAPYVHLSGLPFAELQGEAQCAYIRRVSGALGDLSLSTDDPASDVWRLDNTTSVGAYHIPYHTDNPGYTSPERIVAFWNVHSSAEGGANVILPVQDLFDWAASRPEASALLEDLQRTPVTFTQGARHAVAPMLGPDGTVRFDQRYVGIAGQDLAHQFTALLEDQVDIGQAVKLGEGDALFFDNRSVLHARTPYTDLARVSFRTRVKELPTQ